MENSFVHNRSFDSNQESTKIILALFGGIAAGAVLASLLVSRSKFNLIDRLLHRNGSDLKSDPEHDPALPHPDKYFDEGEEIVIQPT